MKVRFVNDVDTPIGYNIRFVVVMDHQCNGAALAPLDVFLAPATAGASTAFRNLEHTKRFQILYDKMFTFNPMIAHTGAALVSNSAIKSFKIALKLDGQTQFDEAAAAIGSITNNAIQVLCWCDGGSQPPLMSYYSRFRFVG